MNTTPAFLELKAVFPQIPQQILENVLRACDGSAEKAISVILNMLGQEDTLHDDENTSVVLPHREYNSKCGYCGTKDTSTAFGKISFGMSGEKLTVEDYQALIDRGWRRSGTWLYKPNNAKTCCPQHTIRLDTSAFSQTKSQKRIWKRFEKYIDLDEIHHKSSADASTTNTQTSTNTTQSNSDKKTESTNESLQKIIQTHIISAIEAGVASGSNILTQSLIENCKPRDLTSLTVISTNIRPLKKNNQKTSENHNLMHFDCKVALQIDGLNKKANKNQQNTTTPTANDIATEIAKNFHCDLGEAQQITLQVANGHLNFTVVSDTNNNNNKMETDEIQSNKKPKVSTKTDEIENKQKKHQFSTTIVRSSFTKEEYELYRKYQMAVHHDKPEKLTEEGYTNFLVNSPLIYQPFDDDEMTKEASTDVDHYGSYHQLYRIDGKLIAVGVIDILPKCLSSVYFFYDPDYSFLDLGVISALNEINWVKTISPKIPDLKYYYLGFYIHSCQKMRYKAQYKPSDLLCPENYEWVPFSECLPKLEATKYSRFIEKEPPKMNEQDLSDAMMKVPLFWKEQVLHLKDFTPPGQRIIKGILTNYIPLVGTQLSERMLCGVK